MVWSREAANIDLPEANSDSQRGSRNVARFGRFSVVIVACQGVHFWPRQLHLKLADLTSWGREQAD